MKLPQMQLLQELKSKSDSCIWVISKIGGPFLGSPHNEDQNTLGSILVRVVFGNSHIRKSGQKRDETFLGSYYYTELPKALA